VAWGRTHGLPGVIIKNEVLPGGENWHGKEGGESIAPHKKEGICKKGKKREDLQEDNGITKTMTSGGGESSWPEKKQVAQVKRVTEVYLKKGDTKWKRGELSTKEKSLEKGTPSRKWGLSGSMEKKGSRRRGLVASEEF